MSLSEIALWNMALERIGHTDGVASVAEHSKAARSCALWYPLCRDAVLASHDWDFARRRVALVTLGTPPTQWGYRYAAPDANEVIQFLAIDDGRVIRRADQRIPFEVEAAAIAESATQIILSDQQDAVMLYTARITNTALFPPHFADALAWRLALDLSMPMAVSQQVQVRCDQRWLLALSVARATDLRGSQERPLPDSEFIQARA